MCFSNKLRAVLPMIALWLASVCGIDVSQAQEHVLVLRNGNTLSGQVTKNGQQFELRTQSSRLVIEQAQVDFVCNSLADAYDLKYADTPPNDVEGQQRLFRWCMRNQLWPQAKNQIQTIKLSNVKPATLSHLQRQLDVQLEQVRLRSEQRRQQRSQQRIAVANGGSTGFEPLAGQADINASSIKQVGYEEEAEIAPLPGASDVGTNPFDEETPVETELQRRMALQREMEELADSLPEGAVSKYKRQIESNLIVGCYAASCHNTEQPDLPLMVIGRYKSVPKRMSQRNLHSVLKFVDFESPLDSQLLRSATEPHGGVAKPAFTEEMVEYENLKRWLLMFATPAAIAKYQAMELEKQQQHELQALEQSQTESKASEFDTSLPGEIRQVSAMIPDDPNLPSIPDINPARIFVPRDPFDPEIFNRKYRNQK